MVKGVHTGEENRLGESGSIWSFVRVSFYVQSELCIARYRKENITTQLFGPTSEWVRWTATRPSPAEGCSLVAGGFVSG